jgi:hypothetical protein
VAGDSTLRLGSDTVYRDPNLDPFLHLTVKMTKEARKKASLKYYQRYFFLKSAMLLKCSFPSRNKEVENKKASECMRQLRSRR